MREKVCRRYKIVLLSSRSCKYSCSNQHSYHQTNQHSYHQTNQHSYHQNGYKYDSAGTTNGYNSADV
jgi:hypothetical protein